MQGAGPLVHLIVMAGNFDSSTANQTLRDFEPAIPVTSEALIVGALALVGGCRDASLRLADPASMARAAGSAPGQRGVRRRAVPSEALTIF